MWKQNFTPKFRSYLTQERKFRKKIVKKIQKIIKPLPSIIFSQNRMRLAKKVKIKFYSRIPFLLDPGKKITNKNSKKNSKNYKTSSRYYLSQKRDEIGRKSENKVLLQYSVHTRLGEENSEKNSKKRRKIIKPLPGIIFSQNGMR